nr:TonB-dependent receptor [Paraflavitalea speifideiaquila]
MNGNYNYTFPYGLGPSGGLLLPNPVAQTELDINNSRAYRGLIKLAAEIKLLKNLTFSSSFGTDFMLNEAKEKNHPLVSIAKGYIREQTFRTANIINTNLLQYNKQWSNKHSLSVLGGQEARIENSKFIFLSKDDITANPDQDQLYGGNSIGAAFGNTSKQTFLSYFGQVSYGFLERYYLSGSIRTDGSSSFGKNNRFGTYWSAGAGWLASAEPFMKPASSWLSYLKFRGSIGQAGNSAAITDRLRFDPLALVSFMNGTAVFPIEGSPGNPSIQWEQTFTWDGGVEIRLFKDRINLIADIYTRKTKNLIAYDITAPLGTGASTLTGNIGDVKNQGIELSISAQIFRQKDFSWNIVAIWSKNQNKLTKSFVPRNTVAGTNLVNEVGYEYNSYFLPKWVGVNSENGRPQWMDSTGKPTENYYAAKPSIVGKAQPDGFGSIRNLFSYDNLSLSIDFYYQYGSQIYADSKLQNDGNMSGDPYLNQTKKPSIVGGNQEILQIIQEDCSMVKPSHHQEQSLIRELSLPPDTYLKVILSDWQTLD